MQKARRGIKKRKAAKWEGDRRRVLTEKAWQGVVGGGGGAKAAARRMRI